MDITKITQKIDHTNLDVCATEKDIFSLCDEAMRFSSASVCIPPSFVKSATGYVCGKMKICTVIGFPNGYQTAESKCFEAKNAIENGADEIDVVTNIGFLKDKKFDEILDELKILRAVCEGKILKVIVETCLLTEDEKIKMCEIVTKSGADFIKTSTAFNGEGAKIGDITLFKKHVGKNVKIKASGGIKTLEDAEKMISAGSDRIGASKVIKSLL